MGKRILDMEGGEWEGDEGGIVPLSEVKDPAKERLKRVAIASGSVISSPLGVRRGAEVGGSHRKELQ